MSTSPLLTINRCLAESGEQTVAQWLQVIQDDQRASHPGQVPPIEDYLCHLPELAVDAEAVLDALCGEMIVREERGESLDVDHFIDRFPHHAEAIRRQFQLHETLRMVGDTVFPSPGDTPLETSPTMANAASHVDRSPRFEDIEIESVCGRGGMGTVYLGRNDKLDRRVAIKTLSASVDAGSPQAKRMEREARVVAQIDDPNVVKVFEVRSDEDGRPVIVMEYVDGGTLAERLTAGPLTPTAARNWMLDIAGGVAAAHRQGLIHRDLKPANILLTTEGTPKVADFGLVRDQTRPRADESSINAFIGTPTYASPEQARAESDALTPASDVYSLGVILYEMLTGRPPFQATTSWEIVHDILTEDATPARQLNRRIPVDLETVCHHCLEKSPRKRYADADELRQDLQRIADGRPIAAKRTSPMVKTWKWCRRHPAAASLIGVIVFSVILFLALSRLSQNRIRLALKETQIAMAAADAGRTLAIDAMNDLVYDVHDTLQRRQASIQARDEVLQAAISGLERITTDMPNDERSLLCLADAYTRHAYILDQQSKPEEAAAEYHRALEVIQSRKSVDAKRLTATITTNLAEFSLRQFQLDDSESFSRDALVQLRELLEEIPQDPGLQRIVCVNENNLARLDAMRDDLPAAIKAGQRASDQVNVLIEADPENPALLELLVKTESGLASYFSFSGRSNDAAQTYRRVVERLEPMIPSENAEIQTGYFNALLELSYLQLMQTRYGDAEQGLRRVCDAYRKMVETEPNRYGFRLRLAYAHQRLAEVCFATDQLDLAMENGRESIEQYMTAIDMNPGLAIQRSQVAACHLIIFKCQNRQREFDAAANSIQQALAAIQPIANVDSMKPFVDWLEVNARLFTAAVSARANSPESIESVTANGEHGDGDGGDIDRFQRGIELIDLVHRDQFDDYEPNLAKLIDDAAETDDPVVGQRILFWVAVARGRYHRWLHQRDPDGAAATKSQVIEAIELYEKTPNADASLAIIDPAFMTVRGSNGIQ